MPGVCARKYLSVTGRAAFRQTRMQGWIRHNGDTAGYVWIPAGF